MFYVSLLEFYVDLKNSSEIMLKSVFINDEKQYKIEKILNKKNFKKQT